MSNSIAIASPFGLFRAGALAPDLLLPVAAFGLLCAGTVVTLATGLWLTDDHSYAPIIVLLSIGMAIAVNLRREANISQRPSNVGLALLVGALLLFLAGIIINNLFARSAGLWGAALGTTLFLGGWAALRAHGYPFLAALFALPLPGAVVVAVTFPLKLSISTLAGKLLWHLGYPVSTSGVLIEIGNYRLLVADACSGLQSMYSLVAVAIVYMFLMRVPFGPRTLFLALCALPIIYGLNIGRVVALALITYHFGDAAGQGFMHGVAGIAMFVLAFFLLMLVDRSSDRLWRRLSA